MNTQYIYLSNIPSNYKPVLLLQELKNKWARMLYLENSFSGLRDAFIYNPTGSFAHFCSGVQSLRDKIIDGDKSLSVYFVSVPPVNVFVTTMIPAGASMLSYLFVENLHKDVIPSEVIYDLPLQMSDIKNWDIPERQDKCLIIKLPSVCNPALISCVIGTLRRRQIRGLQPSVSELIISEYPHLSNQFVHRSLTMQNTCQESYLANFFYLHDIPSNLTVKMLIEAAKLENIRGAQVFFLETKSNMKYGFMYVPRSLPNVRFMALYEKLKVAEFPLSEVEMGRVKINKAWFQPENAEAPKAKDGEMILTDYLYLSGVPPGVQALQLSLGCPWPIKLYVFQVNEIATQIGFVVLRGIGSREAQLVVQHLRSLDLGGTRMRVDEVHLECKNVYPSIEDRPFQLRPRVPMVVIAAKRCLSPLPVSRCLQEEVVVLTKAPDYDNSVMKTDFICVDNLPKNVSKAALIFDIGRPSDGCILIPNRQYVTAFIYFPECDIDSWKSILKKLSHKVFDGRKSDVYEVYLKTEFSQSNTSRASDQSFLDTDILFAYNIARSVDNHEVRELGHSLIDYCELLETTAGSKSAFILLRDSCGNDNKVAFVHGIRKEFLHGKPVYADLVKLAPIRTVLSDSNDNKKSRYT